MRLASLGVDRLHLAGRVPLLIVDERGRFREPRVVAADLDPRVGSCIADVFRDMRLDSPAGESRVVTVPLWLPPTP